MNLVKLVLNIVIIGVVNMHFLIKWSIKNLVVGRPMQKV